MRPNRSLVKRLGSLALVAAVAALGCGSKQEAGKQAEAPEPDYVTVQHVLIGFEGSVPGKHITRSRESARELAQKVFEMAEAGRDFGKLVEEFTDDAYPGIYKMANFGVPADPARKIYPREKMVQAFGDVGFPLAVGEVGLAEYDPVTSKYGWHVIKRIE